MSDEPRHREQPSSDRPSPREGAATSSSGTPVPVDTSIDRQARTALIVFLIGPILWATHFGIVYLVAEAGCTGAGMGLRFLDPPVPTIVAVVATVVAGIACLGTAWWAYRRWRAVASRTADEDAAVRTGLPGDDVRGGTLEFAGFLLSLLSFVSVLMVGLPALALTPC